MRKRAKALTVAAAMVTTFAILPTLGAAAAEPLDDGSYDVTVGESTWTVEVVDGAPVVGDLDGVEFIFDFDSETGRVLDEFDVAVDGTSYAVTIAEDGTVQVTGASDDEEAEQGTEEGSEGTDGTEESEEGSQEGADDGETTAEEDESDGQLEALEEDEGAEALEEEDDEADSAHGELVSTVAQCAPRGWQARDAGLPNHGFFVSAAARGETIEFEADGATLTADLTTQSGAEAFCALAAELVDTAAQDGTEQDAEATGEAELEADDTDEARGNGKGRSGDARDRSGDAPGRSGDAPGRTKKGR